MLKAKLLMPVMKTLNESETAFAAPAKKGAYPKEVIELAMELFKKYETMESVLQIFRKIYQYGDLRFTISLREKTCKQQLWQREHLHTSLFGRCENEMIRMEEVLRAANQLSNDLDR